ncbi:MAG: hypothetical protein LBB58_05635 [Cellulomonadaceae bacterium]|nr:hypothetical protein [Cellulomonadaceae bacterium]
MNSAVVIEVAPDVRDDITERAARRNMERSDYLRMVSDRVERADREAYLSALDNVAGKYSYPPGYLADLRAEWSA